MRKWTKGLKGLLSTIDQDETIVRKKMGDNGELVDETFEDGSVKRVKFWESITINFPEIITRDDEKEAKSLTMDIGNELVSKSTASQSRGYNYDEEKILIEKEKIESMKVNRKIEGNS